MFCVVHPPAALEAHHRVARDKPMHSQLCAPRREAHADGTTTVREHYGSRTQSPGRLPQGGRNMKIEDAIEQVNSRIAQIERANPTGVLQPWDFDACPAAREHWGLVQQRSALSRPHPENRACCAGLSLEPIEMSPAQRLAAESNGARLAASRVNQDALPTP